MKKVVKLLVCLVICFSVSGCFSFSNVYTRNSTNELGACKDCVSVISIEGLVDNVEKTMKKVNAVSGNYELINTKQTFNVSFDAITKNKRIDWDLYAKTVSDNKEISIYFKDKNFYIIYPNNGANVILKDKVTNLVTEFKSSLDALNATYNKENFENMLTGDKLEGFDFVGMRQNATYVVNEDGSYIIKYNENDLEWELDISNQYLITQIRCKAINFNSTLNITYPKTLSITYPMGLDFLTLDIDEVKELLEVDSFAQIIDKDLKEKNDK